MNPEFLSLETDNAQLVFARRGDVWTWAHLGASGCDPAECAALAVSRPPRHHHCPCGSRETYPAFGSERGQNAADLGNARGGLQVRHADGDVSVQWRCRDCSYLQNSDATEVESESRKSGCRKSELRLTYADCAHPSFTAVQHFVAHPDCDVFETWVELRHDESGPVEISRMASFCLESAGLSERFHLLSLSGAWAAEANVAEEELPRGREVVLGARSGVHDSWENFQGFMISVGDAPATEESGRVFAGALCWSGAWETRLRHEWSHELHVSSGVANLSGPYVLEPGRTLTLPKFVFTWSERGKGAASRALHRWARRHLMPHGDAPRRIVINSWEALRFDLSEERLVRMMDGAKALGAECLVVDDGWFGRGAFARNDTGHGLGDWTPDPKKFPRGLSPLAAEAKKRGLSLGLWFEPEMADVESELLRDHPDWALRENGRPLRRQRGGGQVVLDMANPAVRDWLFDRIDAVIRSVPGLSYVKWDANAEIANFASPWLSGCVSAPGSAGSQPATGGAASRRASSRIAARPEAAPPIASRQGNLWFDYTAGLYDLMARLRAAHPRVVFQSCASGGGRADFGALAFADEFWASDNTGAQQRVLIQHGWSHFFPACAVAAHVTTSPNKHVRRVSSLRYRFDVAFTGRLGIELRPEELTAEETEYARRRVAEYKRLRSVVQGGDLYRLHAPREGGYGALAIVAPDRRRAVISVVGLSRHASDGRLAPLRVPGLDPEARYRVRELGIPGSAGIEGVRLMSAACSSRRGETPRLPCPQAGSPRSQDSHIDFSGKAFSGAVIAAAGLPFDLKSGDDSFVLELSATNQGTHK